MNKPEPVRELIKALYNHFPEIDVSDERGGVSSTVWWIDISASNLHVVVQWTADSDFRLEVVGSTDLAYGIMPEERYTTVELTIDRIKQLL